MKLNTEEIDLEAKFAVLDTELSPTINMNHLFSRFYNNAYEQQRIQNLTNILMEDLIYQANEKGLNDSFFLHIAPNNGISNGKENLKLAVKGDIGTTDIQFMIKGAVKESGLLVLLNKHIFNKKGYYPFGEKFNARIAPKSFKELITLCVRKIKKKDMPCIVGVGDTVTSNKCTKTGIWLRGGSDRGFLTLIKELGKEYGIDNKVIIVDSSHGEVYRPSLKNGNRKGISDPEDNLKFDLVIEGGPDSYIKWFNELAIMRKGP